MIVKIYIGNDRVDLFGDEKISVTSNVATINDITRNLTDFSKTFSVPASENNNRIFKHYYDANINNTFDARLRVNGRIELDGMPFKVGRWRLESVNVSKNRPESYSITFWGNTSSLKDLFGEDEISTLDWSLENHNYNSSNVRSGLVSLVPDGNNNVAYTTLVNRQYYYNSDANDNTITDTLVNVAYQGGVGNNGIIWSDLRPSVRLLRVIELVEEKYNIEFSRDFFGKTEFSSLWFWCNNNTNLEIKPSEGLIDWSSGSSPYVNVATNIGTFPITETNYFEFNIIITPNGGFGSIPYTLSYYVDGVLSASWNLQGTQTKTVSLNTDTPQDKEVYFAISSPNNLNFQAEWQQTPKQLGQPDSPQVGNVAFDTTSSEFNIASNIPKIKIIDILRGLFKMFKLVVEYNDGVYYVDTFDRYYKSGKLYDLSNYIDYDKTKVSRGDILKEINYKFQEPTTVLNKEYDRINGVGYGDLEFKLTDENGNALDGNTQDYELPFEQVIYERLNDINDGSETHFMYGLIADEEIKSVVPKLHIHYINKVNQSTKRIGYITDTGIKQDISSINTATHVDSIDSPLFSTVFETNIEEYSGVAIENTLYLLYHSSYIGSIFNIKRRNFNFSAVLPLIAMLQIKLNDTIQIASNYYRINNITTDLTTGESTLDLINAFEPVNGGFNAYPLNFFINFNAQQLTTFVTKLGEYTFNKIDNGFGVDWVTVSDNGTDLLFDVEQNNTGLPRDIFINFISEETLQEFTIYINQSITIVTADSNIITADSNEITADNG